MIVMRKLVIIFPLFLLLVAGCASEKKVTTTKKKKTTTATTEGTGDVKIGKKVRTHNPRALTRPTKTNTGKKGQVTTDTLNITPKR
jgi:uncharacterized protein YcfL